MVCYDDGDDDDDDDDALRFITGFDVFGHATGDNAMAVLHEAISSHGKLASVLPDHSSQFY